MISSTNRNNNNASRSPADPVATATATRAMAEGLEDVAKRTALTAGVPLAVVLNTVVGGGLSAIQNQRRVKAGQMSAGEAVADTTKDTFVSGVSGAAGMVLGNVAARSVPGGGVWGFVAGLGGAMIGSLVTSRAAHSVLDPLVPGKD